MRTTYCDFCHCTTEGHSLACPECDHTGWIEHRETNAMPITTDEDARADIKLVRKYASAAKDEVGCAMQRLCLYVAERLPKKTKRVRGLSIGDTDYGRVDERNIIERIRVAIDNNEGYMVIGSAYEVPDDN